MKAIILSAGLGTRLRPMTDCLPKVMVPIKNKPLLEYHIENLIKYKITDIGINLNYLPKKIEDYFGDGSKIGVNIYYSREEQLLGTAGSLNGFKRWLGDDEFFVIYGDNFCQINYQKIMEYSIKKENFMGIIGLKHSVILEGKGLVKLNKDNLIKNFIEKPKNPQKFKTDLINGGIYLLKNSIFDFIPKTGFSDFSFDVFPGILETDRLLYGYIIEESLIDIGTLDAYQKVIAKNK